MNQQTIQLVPGATLMLQPALAQAIGLNEAIFLQQLHYWLQQRPHFYDEKPWIYNTMDQWREQFSFWSKSTLERIIRNLREKKLITTTAKYNRFSQDRRLWYTLNYAEIPALDQPKSENQTHQIDGFQDHINLTDSDHQNDGLLDHVNLTDSAHQNDGLLDTLNLTDSDPQNDGLLHTVNLTASNPQYEGTDPLNLNDSSIYKRLTTEITTKNTTTTTTEPRDLAPSDDAEEVVVVSHPPEVVQLIEIGIPEPKAVEIFNTHGPAYIQEKIDILHSQPEVRYPSRWLLSALEKDFQPENYVRPDPDEQQRQKFTQQMAAEQQTYRIQETARLAEAREAEAQRFQALHNQHGISQYHFDCWKSGLGYCKDFMLKGNQLLTQAVESTILLAFSGNHARIGVLDGAMMFQLQQRGKQFLQEAIAYAMQDELQTAKITYELEQL